MLEDKVAIVTGGGTGIGRAISQHLARAASAVAIVYSRSETDAFEAVEAIEAEGGRAIAIKCNVANDAEVHAVVNAVHRTLGGVDYLVNNAAITRQLPFGDLDAINDETWNELYDVNVKGAFHVARAVAPFMRTRADPSIVNVGSIAGVTGFGSSLPYAVSKAALHGLTRSLARALAPKIRVNGIAPGMVETRWWAGNEEKMHMLAGTVALNRVASPADMAEIVLTLLTAKAMTGQIVVADNGQTL